MFSATTARITRLALTLSLLALPALPAAAAPADEAAPQARSYGDPAEAALGKAFAAALQNDFQAYLAVVHPNEKANPQQLSQLEKYTFARFARQAAWYLSGSDASSFVVDRREDLGGGKVKLFIKDVAHPSRAAVPVTLEKSGGAFLILANSL